MTVDIGDAVVGLSLVVADDRCARIHGALGVHDRLERFVVDIDELEGVLRDVAGLGDDEGHLLTLEANLVSCEHCLGVIRQGRHPREVVAEQLRTRNAGKRCAREDCDNTWKGLRRRGVDGLDAGVRERAAQDRTVEHAGQVHVIDVVALTTDESLVLDALHAAEPDRVSGCAQRHLLGGGHADTSSPAGCSAAHWMDSTMFL